MLKTNVKRKDSGLMLLDTVNCHAIKWVLLLGVYFFNNASNAQSQAETLSFKNNGQVVVLKKIDNGFLSDSSGQTYAFNKKILIESSSSLNDIKTLHPSIERVQLIA